MMDAWLNSSEAILALAPMQDVTDLPFWRLMARYGGADVYWTEYFRVHAESHLDRYILQSITENPTGRPVVAQMIGNDVPALVRTAKELQQHPVAAIDLNLGCPAPVVYRKCAGGGLLRDPQKIDTILGGLREAVAVPFTVKTRIGFDASDVFETLLRLFQKHAVDLVTVHGRTVTQMYRPGVRYDLIAQASRELRCPVLANGNVYGPHQALELLAETGASELMIGRGAIRNPWMFDQIRQVRRGEAPRLPTGRDVLQYIHELWDAQSTDDAPEHLQAQRMKKFMNFIGEGVGPTVGSSRSTVRSSHAQQVGSSRCDDRERRSAASPTLAQDFLFEIRRVQTRGEFFSICAAYLDHSQPMTLMPSDVGGVDTGGGNGVKGTSSFEWTQNGLRRFQPRMNTD